MNLERLWKNETVRRRLSSMPVHLLALATVTTYCVAISWRRWPDPLIDCGCELYRAWRIAQGDVLYRDMSCSYGPLSQYVNATIFTLFGAGLMHLAWANLLVFGVIVATLYCLLRRAWGGGAALAASALFVAVFGFEQSSYNYITPYSQESTHGLLVLLLLVAALERWRIHSNRFWSFSVGLLLGLTAMLKIEILLAAFLLVIAAAVLQWRLGRRLDHGGLVAFLAGVLIPTLLFVGYFAGRLPPREAWAAAGHLWLNPAGTITNARDPIQVAFIGFDKPWAHFIEHLKATAIATVMIMSVIALAKIADRQRHPARSAAIGIGMLALVSTIAWRAISWDDIGRCLPGLALLYLGWQVVILFSSPGSLKSSAINLRLLFAVLAVALISRMLLNGRIYHYGFYQAAMAGAIVPAVLLGESTDWAGVERRGRVIIILGFLALLLPGVAILMSESKRAWQMKTYAVGDGLDRFYTFPPRNEPTGTLVRTVVKSLSQRHGDQTLLVLPEGWMVNYLTRLRCPLAPFFYFNMFTENGKEASLVEQLQRHPPDFVVVISRDLREFGINRYGEAPGRGQLLLRWVMANYRIMETVGGDPLDVRQRGAIILQRAGSPPAN